MIEPGRRQQINWRKFRRSTSIFVVALWLLGVVLEAEWLFVLNPGLDRTLVVYRAAWSGALATACFFGLGYVHAAVRRLERRLDRIEAGAQTTGGTEHG